LNVDEHSRFVGLISFIGSTLIRTNRTGLDCRLLGCKLKLIAYSLQPKVYSLKSIIICGYRRKSAS